MRGLVKLKRVHLFIHVVVTLLLTILVITWAIIPAAADTDSFHFTVTADMRGYHTYFGNVLQAINNGPGPGAFHVSIGDIDDTIPENRAIIDGKFGTTFLWYPIIGNHEAETTADMDWLRDEYNNGNSLRTPLKNFTNQDGPAGSVETTYSWDYGRAHFVVLNEYWNGGTAAGSDAARDGDIVSALYDWLSDDLEENTKPLVFIFGHEPAFPYFRHVGDSLDKYEANRDAFWALLEARGVQAYFCGHGHYYNKRQGDIDNIGLVWQFIDGNAGQDEPGDGLTYLDVVISNNRVTINVYRDGGTGTFSLFESVDTLLWESYSDLEHTAVENSFSGATNHVYMRGEGFDTTDTYKVAYYDGGTNHDGTDGAQIQVDAYTNVADGILESECSFSSHESSSYGTWHAVVYKTTGDVPNSYDLVSDSDPEYVVEDSFSVEQSAIPEFPTVVTGIVVSGICLGIFYWIRKRQKAILNS